MDIIYMGNVLRQVVFECVPSMNQSQRFPQGSPTAPVILGIQVDLLLQTAADLADPTRQRKASTGGGKKLLLCHENGLPKK